VKDGIGAVAHRDKLVRDAKKAVDTSTPLVTSRSGRKRNPKARRKYISINLFINHILEWQGNGMEAPIKHLLEAKGGDVREAAVLLYDKVKQLIFNPGSRHKSTVRSRVEEYFDFIGLSPTAQDSARLTHGTPTTEAGGLEVYSLAQMLEWVKLVPLDGLVVHDTCDTIENLRAAESAELQLSQLGGYDKSCDEFIIRFKTASMSDNDGNLDAMVEENDGATAQ
jgi:hypothetical protein